MRQKDVSLGGSKAASARTRDLGTIDTELRMLATLRRAAREQGRPLPSIVAVDALLDERLRASGRLQPVGSERAPQAVEA